MCQAVRCPSCNQPDWRGCGAHVEQVLGHVPRDQRCRCRESPADAPDATNTKKKLWSRLLGHGA